MVANDFNIFNILPLKEKEYKFNMKPIVEIAGKSWFWS